MARTCPHGAFSFRSVSFLSKWVMAVGEPAVNLPGCNQESHSSLSRLRIRSEGNGTLNAELGGALDAEVTLDLAGGLKDTLLKCAGYNIVR